MKVPCSLTILAAIVTMATADYNKDFCLKHITQQVNTPQDVQKPKFFDNFYMFTEKKQTTNGVLSVGNIELFYAASAGLVHAVDSEPVNSTQIWIDTQFNEQMTVPLAGNDICQDTPFESSPMFKYLRATKAADGSIKLATPELFMGWDSSVQRNITYVGKSNSRGIDTQKWITCEYYDVYDLTTVTEWQITDANSYTMSVNVDSVGENNPVLPISISVVSLDASFNEIRADIDYTHFAHIDPKDRAFQIPATMLCAGKPTTLKPLPTIPQYFKFKAEQVTLSNINGQRPDPPSLTYTVVEYRKTLQIFVQEFISTPQRNSPNDKSYIRIVDDYNTGISYQLDLTSGACITSAIDGSRDDAYSDRNGNVRMRNSDEFFSLDSDKYQYMGIHRIRDIDCDTWATYMVDNAPDHLQNTLYIWYFATYDWMRSNGYQTPFTMPIMLERQSTPQPGSGIVNSLQYHIFEWTDSPDKHVPDVSNCFSTNNTMNVEVFFSGRYDQFYLPDPGSFRQNFLGALVSATGLGSSLRIAELDVQPANNNELVVRFKLLETPRLGGDQRGVTPSQPPVSSQTIFSNFVNKVNGGSFYVDIGSNAKTTLYARPGSAAVTKNKGKFQAVSSSTTIGFTSGAMAGIAVGMLLGGALVVALIVVVVKKLKPSGDDTIAMSSAS
ncbi:uncharacterized protein LOC131928132 isoform X2 [Physella acuta]|nr:uncharacterized protein LOC131928132 isoform X2 [Physella acuta]XP_059140053.1 uncharacterized protein LOC131928132 isoform X2 [Physella acuta]XP_059140054.1 uncharacterized protein LOC131928132 isoform X2 [Physella acuta]